MAAVNSEQGSGIRACRAAEIFDDPASAALFAEYERESAVPLLGPTAPNRAAYEALESTGFAQCFAAYIDDRLCGFAMVLVCVVPHYGRNQATVESLFVARASRGSGIGARLMEALELHAQQAGCAAIFYSAPARSALAVTFFRHEDRYVNTNHVFCRSLQ